MLITLLLLAGLLGAQPLPLSAPDREGLSAQRLTRLHDEFQRMVDQQLRAGAITMIVRNGKIADWKTYGFRDVSARLPMEKDTIFRIWSMTKVITSVSALMLIEEGRMTLSDPVEKFIPELKGLKVYRSGTADNPDLVPPATPITVKHLLTHTSGLTYTWGNHPVHELYRRAKFFEVPQLKDFIGKISSLPLIAQPGERWEYGINTDVLGYLVEVVSDMPFDRFVQTRILDPLKMQDTSFLLPETKRARLAKTYTLKDGKLQEQGSADSLRIEDQGFKPPFGGMGLYSTIGDYARFAQMLLNGGQLDGARLLGRKTVELMTVNHLNHMSSQTISGNGGDGFGLGGAVRIDVAKSNMPGSVGQFGWDGAASTRFRIDPKERTAALLFMQYMPFDAPTLDKFMTLVYQAIAD